MLRTLRKRIVLTLLCCVVAYSAAWCGVQLAKADIHVIAFAA